MRVADTTVTDVYGVGPIVACYLIGDTGDITRFATKDRYARYNATAPLAASSGPKPRHRLNDRGNRQLNHAPRGRHADLARHPRAATTTDASKPNGTATKKHSAPSSDASATPSTPGCKPTHNAEPAGPGGHSGTTLASSVAGESLNTGTSEQPLPNPNNNATTADPDTPRVNIARAQKPDEHAPLTQTGFDMEPP